VVVLPGVTLAEPDSGKAAALILGAMLSEAVLVLFQVSMTDWPSVI
jgi:hypothetical protein